jgi:hypothetical protein
MGLITQLLFVSFANAKLVAKGGSVGNLDATSIQSGCNVD